MSRFKPLGSNLDIRTRKVRGCRRRGGAACGGTAAAVRGGETAVGALEDELRGIGPMSELRAIQLMIGSLEALGEGHKLGIVHKDLKPANLYLTDLGTRKERMRVLDFGIARITDGSARAKFTSTGQVVGTPQYLAPEYIEEQHVSPLMLP